MPCVSMIKEIAKVGAMLSWGVPEPTLDTAPAMVTAGVAPDAANCGAPEFALADHTLPAGEGTAPDDDEAADARWV